MLKKVGRKLQQNLLFINSKKQLPSLYMLRKVGRKFEMMVG
jgi:hypothetical protein